MSLITKLAAAAGLAALAVTAAPEPAAAQLQIQVETQAQHFGPGGYRSDHGYRDRRYDRRGGWRHDGRRGRWNGPEGYFVVNARACPDLREDYRDQRYGHSQRHRYHDRRDRQVLHCPPHAWDYVPSRREARAGRHGDRLRPTEAFWDPRAGRYVVQTRWGWTPVHVHWGRSDYRRHGYHQSGLHFQFRF